MLTEGEVRALTALHGEQMVSHLATNLDRSLSYTSEPQQRRRRRSASGFEE